MKIDSNKQSNNLKVLSNGAKIIIILGILFSSPVPAEKNKEVGKRSVAQSSKKGIKNASTKISPTLEAKARKAREQLTSVITEFSSKNRLQVDSQNLKVFYWETKVKSKKKSFKKMVQHLYVDLFFYQAGERVLPYSPLQIAGKIKTEIVKRHCNLQNLKSKNVLIRVYEPDELKARSLAQENPTAFETQTISLPENPKGPSLSGFNVRGQCR